MADTKHSSSSKPRFSAGLITGIVTLAWLIVFGAVTMHGIDGINQHDNPASSQAE